MDLDFNFDKFIGSGYPPLKEYIELLKELNEERFTAKDLGIKHRIINHWTTEGLIRDQRDSSKEWRKFSFSDYVFIRVLSKFRMLGTPLKNLTELAEIMNLPIFGRLTEDDNRNPLRLIFKGSYLMEGEKVSKNTWGTKGTKEIVTELYVSFFGMQLEDSILFRESLNVAVNDKGDCTFYSRWNELDAYVTKNKWEAYSIVSINEILKEFIRSEKYQHLLEDFSLLNENEMEILRHIRTGDLVELKIRFKGNKPSMLELTNKQPIETEARLIEIITKDGYQDISFSTQKGKVTTIKNTTKKKLSNVTG